MTPLYQIHSYVGCLVRFAINGPKRNDARREFLAPIFALVLAMAAVGCKDFDAPNKDVTGPNADGGLISTPNVFDSGGVAEDGASTTAADGSAADASIEERVLKNDFVLPRASNEFIFIPIPEKHLVMVVDPLDPQRPIDERRPVEETYRRDCGRRPTYIAVPPGSSKSVSIVIDAETDQAYIVRASRAKTQPIPLDEKCRPLAKKGICSVPGANAIAFSPGGRYAVIYYSPEYVGAREPAGGYQEVVIVGLEQGSEWAQRITVGLHPRKVVFSSGLSADKVYFVTDEGISVIESLEKLAKETTKAETYDFGKNIDVSKLKIEISGGGRYAIGNRPNDSTLYLLETTNGKVKSLDMAKVLAWKPEKPDAGPEGDDAGTEADGGADAGSQFPTLLPGEIPAIGDVKLGSVGGIVYALVALPNQSAALRVLIPGGFEDISSITTVYKNERAQNLTISPETTLLDDKTGKPVLDDAKKEISIATALLYDQTRLTPLVTLLRLDKSGPILDKTIRLAGGIESAEFPSEAKNLGLLTHNLKSSRPGAQVVGYTALSLNPPYAKFQATGEPPLESVYVEDAKALFVLVRDDVNSVYELHRVSTDGLFVKVIELDEKPRTLGVLLSDKIKMIFVDQEHSDGHITLFDFDGRLAGSVTGFMLTDRVKE